MGCCASREGTPAVPAHASSRNITAPSTRPNSIPSPRASHASQGNAHPSRSRADANDVPNTPLKPIAIAQRSRLPNALASPSATSRGRVKPLTDSTNLTWTRARLLKERDDWWDTQVTGSPEIWGAIRLAAQYLQGGEVQEAQTMLDVTACTCPSGLLWKGVYDATGVQYKVPEWVVVEPEGLVEEEEMQSAAVTAPADATTVPRVDAIADVGDGEKDEVRQVRARTSHNQRDMVIRIRQREPVASIVEKLKKKAELDLYTKVRLAYGGRLYQDSETLDAHPHWNFANDYVLSALVTL